MDNLDKWLELKIQEAKAPAPVLVQGITPLKISSPFPWSTVVLSIALAVCVFFLVAKEDNPGPDPEPTDKTVVELVEKNTRLYPYNLSLAYTELKKQVDDGIINNGAELLANSKPLTMEALVKSVGNINELDTQYTPKADKETGKWSDEDRAKVSKYLSQKIEGHLKASK